MATIYWQADQQVMDFIYDVMEKYHQELSGHFKIGVLFALSGNENQPSVKHNGYPAFVTIKLVSQKDRITKGYNIEMIIDSEYWKNSCDKSREALIDYALSHLEIKRKQVKKFNQKIPSATEIVVDSSGCPVLKIRKGDWNAGYGFRDVVARHGDYSVEVAAFDQANAIITTLLKEHKGNTDGTDSA